MLRQARTTLARVMILGILNKAAVDKKAQEFLYFHFMRWVRPARLFEQRQTTTHSIEPMRVHTARGGS